MKRLAVSVIGTVMGFWECSVAGADKLTDWLAAHVAHAERNLDRVRPGRLLGIGCELRGFVALALGDRLAAAAVHQRQVDRRRKTTTASEKENAVVSSANTRFGGCSQP